MCYRMRHNTVFPIILLSAFLALTRPKSDHMQLDPEEHRVETPTTMNNLLKCIVFHNTYLTTSKARSDIRVARQLRVEVRVCVVGILCTRKQVRPSKGEAADVPSSCSRPLHVPSPGSHVPGRMVPSPKADDSRSEVPIETQLLH